MELINWDDNPWDVSACIKAFELFRESKELSLDFFHKMSGFMNTCAIGIEDLPAKLCVLMTHIKLAEGTSDAMRKIKSGAIKLNKQQIKDPNFMVTKDLLLFNHWILIQHGKSEAGVVCILSKEICDESN